MPGTPRILVVGLNYAPEPSGNAPYTSYLAQALAKKHNLSVLSTFPHYPWWKVQDGWVGSKVQRLESGVDVTRFRPRLPRKNSNIQRALMEFAFGLRASLASWKKPDVVLLVSPAMLSSCVALLRAKLFNRNAFVVTWVQDIYTVGLRETQGGSGALGKLLRLFEKWLLSNSDRVVAIHERFKEVLVSEFELDASRVEVIRNWSQLHFQPSETAEQTRSNYDWSDRKVVLHAGNQGVKQGLDRLVEVAANVSVSDPSVLFVLVGDGNQRASLERMAAGFLNVVFIDPVDEVELCNLLQAADVLLVHEQTGVAEMAVPSKLTSYFMAGVPVLAVSDAGSISSEEVVNAGAGIRASVGDEVEILAALSTLMSSKEFGANARKYASAKLSGEAAVQSFSGLIGNLDRNKGK